MQTKFKWKPEQRLLIISGLAIGITITPSIETANILGEDVYIFASGKADYINNDEYIQSKLKIVFEKQKLLGKGNIYEKMLELDKDDDQYSFAA